MTLQSSEASPASEVEKPEGETLGSQPDANSAESSNAGNEDAKEPEVTSLLDVVKNVVEKKDEPEGGESSTPEVKQEAAAESTEAKAEEGKEQSDADLPFHTHPRFKQLVEERNAFKADSENWRSITSFMDQTGLNSEEVAQGFEVMAMLKSGTADGLAKARDWFATNLQVLNEQLGDVLPADLQEKVDGGVMDTEAAKELAQARATAKRLETQSAAQTERNEQARAAQAASDARLGMAQAVQTWEDGIKAKDPDYASKKAELVKDKVQALAFARGVPQTNDEAVKLVSDAYEAVNAHLKSLLPKPTPKTPTPSGVSAPATSAPKSLREAIAAAVSN